MSTTSDATLVWWLVAWRDLEIITDVELLGDSVLRPLLLPLLERGCFVVMLYGSCVSERSLEGNELFWVCYYIAQQLESK